MLKKEGFYPGLMSYAERNYFFVVNHMAGYKPILKVQCRSDEFFIDKAVDSRIEYINFMLYLPEEQYIVVSDWKDHIVKTVHCKGGLKAWEVKGRVDGVTWEPHGLFYSREHEALVVCDCQRLVVLIPQCGSFIEAIPLSYEDKVISLYKHGERFILQTEIKGAEKIVVFIKQEAK